MFEYAILAQIAVLATSIGGLEARIAENLSLRDGAARKVAVAEARARKVPLAGARAAYARAPYELPALRALYASGWIAGVKTRASCVSVRLSPETLADHLGWRLEPEGLCRGNVCVPVRNREALVDDAGVDLAGFAELLGRPLALDVGEHAAALGTSSLERRRALTSLEAPDFTLPDLEGRLHSLSNHRGKKVLLIAYASW